MSARPFSVPAALHRTVLDAAERIRDAGLRHLVLAGETERMAAAVARTWQAGTWRDPFGAIKCLGCGGVVTGHSVDGAVCACGSSAVAA